MKKISLFFLALLFICNLSVNVVHADAAMPMDDFGDVVVINEEGARGRSYDYTGREKIITIPYGEVLEPNFMGGNYISVSYKDEHVDIDYHDIKPLEEYYYPDNVDFENKYTESIVINNVYAIYKGPALCYDKIDWIYIPKDNIVKRSGDSNGMWSYIEYEGTQGWIYRYEVSEKDGLTGIPLLADVCNEKGALWDGTTIHYKPDTYVIDGDNDKLDLSNNETFSPVNIKYQFGYSDYYVEGKDFSGWVYSDDIWLDEKAKNVYVTTDYLNIYGDPECRALIDSIEYDGELKVIRTQASTSRYGEYKGLYVEYEKGKMGFIDQEENIVAEWAKESSDEYPIYNEKGICYLYNAPIESSKYIIAKIPQGTRINYQYAYYTSPRWYRVDDGEYHGWVCRDELQTNGSDKYKDYEEEIIIEEEVEKPKETYNILDAVKYGSILVLCVFVIILFFNKDKIKNKINEKKKP